MPSLDPVRRALIVVDVQNDYDRGGSFEIAYPPFAETVRNVARAMDAARAGGIKIVVVKMISPPDAKAFRPGTSGADLHPEIAKRAHDHAVEKRMPSAFTGTDLEYWLRSHGVETVTVVGYMTHNCDLSTVIHAMHMGFGVELLSDATGSFAYENAAGHASAEEIHRVMCVVMQARFAAVLETDAWMAHIAAGTAPARDTIYASKERALAAQRSAA
jgi:nicotinamidase-related amidase